ncbi:unnamed protein product [Rotaria socialis]|uniref:Uncharacterized protein n=1 Tax=Rotaria socialis TaxID=392032 RepID=A0A818DFQ7_9BILA|nr:unnamed protein product [Rotaria socialis]CAF3327031.1 unnamed protein product [Rotaria socialis]CAF3413484.1 unnamed protein product [Rotaria socialis]CAF3446600.1 unnamed protein product [Rotaria socialis]CAF3779994.1 unnamed protein product [Rotaria socialis]
MLPEHQLLREKIENQGCGWVLVWICRTLHPLKAHTHTPILDNIRPLETTKLHLWYYDQTHDNLCEIDIRSVEDVLSHSAMGTFANCSTGSNRGCDELVPHYIDLIHETKFYPK